MLSSLVFLICSECLSYSESIKTYYKIWLGFNHTIMRILYFIHKNHWYGQYKHAH